MFPRRPAATLDSLDTFDDVLARWIDAEARGDSAALQVLLHADFQGDGPRGFVLTKAEWLDRYRSGNLVNHAFTWHDVVVRVYDDSAVAMGVQAQTATYQGDDCTGCSQGTLVALRRDGLWSIVNVQLGSLPDHPTEPS